MSDFSRIIGAAVAFAGMIVLIAPLNALLGAFAGWTVSLFWGDSILVTLRSVGLPPEVTMWQLGAALGFVGAFLRTTVSQNSN